MFLFEENLELVKNWVVEQQALRNLAKKYNVSYSSVRKWIVGYEEYGEEYLKKFKLISEGFIKKIKK